MNLDFQTSGNPQTSSHLMEGKWMAALSERDRIREQMKVEEEMFRQKTKNPKWIQKMSYWERQKTLAEEEIHRQQQYLERVTTSAEQVIASKEAWREECESQIELLNNSLNIPDSVTYQKMAAKVALLDKKIEMLRPDHVPLATPARPAPAAPASGTTPLKKKQPKKVVPHRPLESIPELPAEPTPEPPPSAPAVPDSSGKPERSAVTAKAVPDGKKPFDPEKDEPTTEEEYEAVLAVRRAAAQKRLAAEMLLLEAEERKTAALRAAAAQEQPTSTTVLGSTLRKGAKKMPTVVPTPL